MTGKLPVALAARWPMDRTRDNKLGTAPKKKINTHTTTTAAEEAGAVAPKRDVILYYTEIGNHRLGPETLRPLLRC